MKLSSIAMMGCEFGGRQVALIDLMNEWAARVRKLKADVTLEASDRLAWSVHDLIGSYIIRDMIESTISEATDENDAVRMPLLETVDDDLRSFTVQADDGVLDKIEPVHATNWWWEYVPNVGPIGIEIAQVRDNMGLR